MNRSKFTVKKFFFFIIMISIGGPITAQTYKEGSIYTEIKDIISNMPSDSGDDYSEPSEAQLTKWDGIILHLLAGEYADAAMDAIDLDYILYDFLDTNTGNAYYVLENNGSNYWGTYVFNPNYCRSLVIQSPHPKHDTNTGKQGIYVFRETDAAFFQVSGTHRCNQDELSVCSGLTSTCLPGPDTEKYRISDMAHNTTTIFQKTTERLFSDISDAYFISMHGFGRNPLTDPYVIMSNGTRITPAIDYIDILDDNLWAEDDVLTFEIAHINTNWNRLIGFTNTQGRLINSSTDDCLSNATTTSGRFIHFEQEKQRLRLNQSGWNKVANALSNTFPCAPLAIEQSDSPEERLTAEKLLKIYPNPSNGYFTVEGEWGISQTFKVYNAFAQDISSSVKISVTGKTSIIDLRTMPDGYYFLITTKGFYKLFKHTK